MAKRIPVTRATPRSPEFGLVCLSYGDECRFRTITRTRFLALPVDRRREALRELYWDNVRRLHGALIFCHRRGIKLYRATSSLFPMSDDPVGGDMLDAMAATLSAVGRRAKALGIRVVLHPDQFVVLNSENPQTVKNSREIMAKHAKAFDLMGFPRSPWSAFILHGGKSARAAELIAEIQSLPINVRSRLCLENDEHGYSANEILAICRAARVPMIFDNHHHAIHEKLGDYCHPSFARFTRAAATTWPRREWQIVHLSNGNPGFLDRNHSDYIAEIPPAYAKVPWIEVEARAKELAIERLRAP